MKPLREEAHTSGTGAKIRDAKRAMIPWLSLEMRSCDAQHWDSSCV